jgi:hypothetical protein
VPGVEAHMKHVAAADHKYDRHCHCPACAETRRVLRAEYRAERRARRVLVDGRWVAPVPAPYHGKVNTYREWSCRCVSCTEANANTWRAYRATRRRRADT